ncbi:MAG: cytidine deaminase [Chloroflexi bacterium]|nr:cytidine deaminase [Chloroflexota bacterium]
MITQAQRSELVARASEARQNAYAPYSNYRVGAALLAGSGEVYTGVNVENAVYPTGTCAERTAIFKAVSEGERAFKAIAVVTENGGTPCGSCRQMLAEFGLDTLVLIADASGRVVSETNVRALLPQAFGSADLPPRA